MLGQEVLERNPVDHNPRYPTPHWIHFCFFKDLEQRTWGENLDRDIQVKLVSCHDPYPLLGLLSALISP